MRLCTAHCLILLLIGNYYNFILLQLNTKLVVYYRVHIYTGIVVGVTELLWLFT